MDLELAKAIKSIQIDLSTYVVIESTLNENRSNLYQNRNRQYDIIAGIGS